MRAHALGALERRDRAARRDNQGRQPARPDGADRVGMALLDVHAPPEGPGAGRGRPRGDTVARRRVRRQALPPPRGSVRGRQERVQGQRRRRARARLLGLGNRLPGRGDPRLTPPADKPPAGRARVSTHRRRAFTSPFLGSPRAVPVNKTGFGRARRTENRNAVGRADIGLPGKRRLNVQRARALPTGNEKARLKPGSYDYAY